VPVVVFHRASNELASSQTSKKSGKIRLKEKETMSDKESAQHVIEAYRRKRQGPRSSSLLMLLTVMVVIIGAAVVVVWLIGPNSPMNPKPTHTPTITTTPTFTPTSTTTSTPTVTLTPTEPPPTDTPLPTETPTLSGPSWYIVEEGDTLSGIAVKFNTDLIVLLNMNPGIDANTIKVGDKIIIPAPNTTMDTATPIPPDWRGTIEYTIASGDTLAAIAIKFNSTVQKIMELNKIQNANDIQAGDVIKVPVNIATPIPTATQGTTYPTLPIAATSTATPKP
jgi:LysM repeat protein